MTIVLLILIKLLIIITLIRIRLINIFSTSFLWTISFLFVYIFGLLGNIFFDFENISILTSVFLLTIWITFILFELIGFKLLHKGNNIIIKNNINILLSNHKISANVKILLFSTITYFFISQLKNLLSILEKGTFSMSRSCYIYPELEACEFSYLPLHGIISLLAEMSFLILIVNLIFKKFSKINILFVLLYLTSCGLSAERILIVDALAVIIVLFILRMFLNNTYKNLYKTLFNSFIFLSAFVVLGLISGNQVKLFQYLISYFGFPLFGLNELINNPIHYSDFDKRINFRVIRELLSYLDMSDSLEKPNLKFSKIGNISSNIYTSFFRYIHEFGYIVCYLLTALMGCFYGITQALLTKWKNIYILLFYLLVIFPIPMVMIEERFYNILLGTNLFKYVILLTLIFYLTKLKISNENN